VRAPNFPCNPQLEAVSAGLFAVESEVQREKPPLTEQICNEDSRENDSFRV